ncbi:MAG: hypothetical protein JW797_02265 [Bradymonadales bacterium]|nr:hypothetical protein [Bradymonadales bacterium]
MSELHGKSGKEGDGLPGCRVPRLARVHSGSGRMAKDGGGVQTGPQDPDGRASRSAEQGGLPVDRGRFDVDSYLVEAIRQLGWP